MRREIKNHVCALGLGRKKRRRNNLLTSVKHFHETEIGLGFCIHRLVLLLVVFDFVMEIDGCFFGTHLTVVLTELQYLLPYRKRIK